MNKNNVPVTSSHNWCMARQNKRNVVRTPLMMALKVRLRPACCPATRATTPSFLRVETLLTTSILTASGATMTEPRTGGEPFRRPSHPKAHDDDANDYT